LARNQELAKLVKLVYSRSFRDRLVDPVITNVITELCLVEGHHSSCMDC
jgi:hypothetical protein